MGTFRRITGLLLLLAAAGCGTSGIVGQGALKQEQEAEIPIYKRVVVNNTSLGRDIAVIDTRVAQTGDILQAAVTLESRTGSTLALQYKFVWIDAKGFEIDPGSGTWKPLTIYGKEVRQLQGVAPRPSAIEFMLKIRRDQ
jgi:uncharacterized protein YcfL